MQRAAREVENWQGAAVYTQRSLRLYDLVVLGLSNRLAWRCATARQLAFFDAHFSDNHLDVGVGSGYYTANCRYPGQPQRLALMDLNPDCLAFAKARMARRGIDVSLHTADVLAPINWQDRRFRSISAFFLLHCLPGTMADKVAALRHLASLLEPGGVVYGTTILGAGGTPNALARGLMAIYNRKGIFSNAQDDLEGLRAALMETFERHELQQEGDVALFCGWCD